MEPSSFPSQSVTTVTLTKNVIVLYVQIPHTVENDFERVQEIVTRHDEVYGEQFRAAGFTVLSVPSTLSVTLTETTEECAVIKIDIHNLPSAVAERFAKSTYEKASKVFNKVVVIPQR